MASFFTLITATGQAKIAAAIAAGTAVSLTHMAVGDGNGNPITPAENMTALVRERYRAAVTNLRQHETNSNWLVAELVIPTTVGGWTVHEVGLFDTDGALIAIGSFPATYKPVLAEGSTRELVARIILEVSDTAAITLIVDPTIVMASRQWVIDNYSAGKLFPGGTTGQLLRKKSNTTGDVEWANATDVNVTADTRQEIQTLAADQTVIDLAVVNTVGLAVYVEGAREFDVAVNSSTRITLPRSYPAGTRVLCVQNDPMGYVQATTEGMGFVELATDAEAVAGTDTERAMTPAAAKAALTGSVRAYGKQHYFVPVPMASVAGAVAVDCDIHAKARLVLTENSTVSAATNQADGKEVVIKITGASTYTLGWDASYKPSKERPLPAAPAAGKSITVCFESDGTNMHLIGYRSEV